jgi:hypothetical protein
MESTENKLHGSHNIFSLKLHLKFYSTEIDRCNDIMRNVITYISNKLINEKQDI